MMLKTPPSIDQSVRALCQKIKAPDSGEPIYLTITPETGCDASDCFHCVKRKIETHGGRIQTGWAIWTWPNVFFEGEHHAVYEPPAGPPWLDITPPNDPSIRQRLFLPDDRATYDFANEGVRRDNVRLALVHDPLVESFFAAFEQRAELENSVPGLGVVEIEGEKAIQYRQILNRIAEIQVQIIMKYTPQGAPCPCGSGQKFKRCHGAGKVLR